MLACSEAAVQPTEIPKTTSSSVAQSIYVPLRLVDEAVIEKDPLQSLGTAAAEAGTETKTVFRENFDQLSAAKLGWTGSAANVVRVKGRGKVLRYRGGGRRLGFLVSIKGNTVYRLRRSIQRSRDGDAQVDLKIAETDVPLLHAGTLNHPQDRERVWRGRFVAAKHLLYVHRFLGATAGVDWHTNEIRFTSARSARSLLLYIADAEGSVAATKRRVLFDDIVLEELTLGPEARLVNLRDRWNEDPNMQDMLRKHGQFLPIPRVSAIEVGASLEYNFDYREGLLAPANTSFTITLDGRASVERRLDYSVALLGASAPDTSLGFRVELNGKPLANDLLTMRDTLPQWQRRRVRIPEGSSGLLRLVTEGDDRAYGVWGNPVLVDEKPERSNRPNVLIIAVDTLRADRLTVYGGKPAVSPNIDRLAAEGIRFTRAISASNWTTSAFASLFTGLMPSSHGVIHRSRSVPRARRTLAEYFQSAGYITQGIAYKAYLYDMGFEQGFDEWFNVPRSDVTATDNLERAKSFLARVEDQPFFLFFHLNDPHQPMNQPRNFVDRFVDRKTQDRLGMRFPLTIGTKNNILGCSRCAVDGKLAPGFKEAGRGLYDSAVAFTDDNIGALLNELRRLGMYDNTIIALVADHGEVMWERGNYFGHGGTFLSDELVHVPLIIKGVSGNQATSPRVVEAQVRSYDLMPTLLSMAKVPYRHGSMEARDLAPLWRAEERDDRLAISENIKQNVTMVCDGRWKLVAQHSRGQFTRTQLYDVVRDPREQHEVAREHLDILGKLQERLVRYWLEHRPGRYLVGRLSNSDHLVIPETREALQVIVGKSKTRHKAMYLGPGPSQLFFARLSDDRGDWKDASGKILAKSHLPVSWRPEGPTGEQRATVDALLSAPLQLVVIGGTKAVPDDAERSGMSADQIATLRAQGYIQ